MLIELRQLSSDGKLPKGALLEAKPTIEFTSQQYDVIKRIDAQNEKRPSKADIKWSKYYITNQTNTLVYKNNYTNNSFYVLKIIF